MFSVSLWLGGSWLKAPSKTSQQALPLTPLRTRASTVSSLILWGLGVCVCVCVCNVYACVYTCLHMGEDCGVYLCLKLRLRIFLSSSLLHVLRHKPVVEFGAPILVCPRYSNSASQVLGLQVANILVSFYMLLGIQTQSSSFETGSHIAQAGFKFAMQLRMT